MDVSVAVVGALSWDFPRFENSDGAGLGGAEVSDVVGLFRKLKAFEAGAEEVVVSAGGCGCDCAVEGKLSAGFEAKLPNRGAVDVDGEDAVVVDCPPSVNGFALGASLWAPGVLVVPVSCALFKFWKRPPSFGAGRFPKRSEPPALGVEPKTLGCCILGAAADESGALLVFKLNPLKPPPVAVEFPNKLGALFPPGAVFGGGPAGVVELPKRLGAGLLVGVVVFRPPKRLGA